MFCIKGFEYITGNDNLYANSTPYGIKNFALNNGFYKTDGINCYLPYVFKQNTNYENASGAFSGGNRIYVRTHYAHYGEKTLPLITSHELGHMFGLLHTFGPTNAGNGIVEEHVTRNQMDSNYNADTEGDKVHDTPAIPNFWNSAFGSWTTSDGQSMSILDTTNCTFDSSNYSFTDNQGTPLQITTYDVQNYMTYGALKCKSQILSLKSV